MYWSFNKILLNWVHWSFNKIWLKWLHLEYLCHKYVPLVVNTSRVFPHSWLITGFVTRITRLCDRSNRNCLHFRSTWVYPRFSDSIFSFMCMLCRSLFVLLSFFLTIALSVLRFTDSDSSCRSTKSCGHGCIGRSTKSCGNGCIGCSSKSISNGLHWSFNKILFKWVALVVQHNLVEVVRSFFYIVVSRVFQVLRSLVFIHDNTFRIWLNGRPKFM